MKKIGLSVIIPVFNSQDWIRPTYEHLARALKKSDFDAEIIIIDDGSLDNSVEVARSLESTKNLNVHVIAQKNAGRYMARKAGVLKSTKENILFVDSRVYVDEHSLEYLSSELQTSPRQLWNGHVNIDKRGNVFARFWDAIVCIAWRRYFKHPERTSYTLKDFDFYPKGTGFFYVPKELLVDAMEHFEEVTNDIKFSSDDTLLIRYLNKQLPINLSPQFSCLYHGRSNLKSFLKHAYNRGQFFIDGFLRPGTRFFFPLISILLLSVIVLISLFIWPLYTLVFTTLLLFASLLLSVPFVLLTGVVFKDMLSLVLLAPPFAVVYLSGLWRGVFRKIWK